MYPLVTIASGVPVVLEDNVQFLRDQIGDREVFVVAICGRSRTGKSLLMTVLNAKLETPSVLEVPTATLCSANGFDFRSGPTAHTKGIDAAQEIHFVRDKDGKEIAVLLLDSQGLFDNQSDGPKSRQIFHILSSLASVLIVNMKELDSQMLDKLHTFIQECRANGCEKYKKLILLNRDFPGDDGYNYGEDGEYLESLQRDAQGTNDLHTIWTGIGESADQLVYYTMPTPGREVMRATGTVEVAELGEDFSHCLGNFVDLVFSDITPKMLADVPLSGTNLENVLQSCVAGIAGRTQNPVNVHQINEEREFLRADRLGQEAYRRELEEIGALEETSLSVMKNAYARAVEAGVNVFHSIPRQVRDDILGENTRNFQKGLEVKVRGMLLINAARICGKYVEDAISMYKREMTASSYQNAQVEHQAALAIARAQFEEATREFYEDMELSITADVHKTDLERKIEEEFSFITCALQNYQLPAIDHECRNEVTAACLMYRTTMYEVDVHRCSEDQLESINTTAAETARSSLRMNLENIYNRSGSLTEVLTLTNRYRDHFENDLRIAVFDVLGNIQQRRAAQGTVVQQDQFDQPPPLYNQRYDERRYADPDNPAWLNPLLTLLAAIPFGRIFRYFF